ncbi:MAG: universal stress protein [Pseudohongiellaceae bacterium]
MNTIRNILVVIDPTVERDSVIERANLIAKLTNAKVNLFINNTNFLSPHNFNYEGISAEFFELQQKLFEEHHGKILNQLVSEFTDAGIPASSDMASGHNLAEAIIEKVNTLGPDLVLKSTHHHGAIQRSFMSNTDWRLIRKCPAPLMLVKPQSWQESGSIVTAIDPMHAKAEQTTLDELLLSTTKTVAHSLDLSPHVFHSYFPFVSSLFPMGGESEEYLFRIRKQHEEKLRALTQKHGFDDSSIHLSQGELVPSIIHYLEKCNANLLVIGALSRNALERAIIGNTAEKILENSPCDILIMKTT